MNDSAVVCCLHFLDLAETSKEVSREPAVQPVLIQVPTGVGESTRRRTGGARKVFQRRDKLVRAIAWKALRSRKALVCKTLATPRLAVVLCKYANKQLP